MAQDGDTITYTHDGDINTNNNLIPETEDVSNVNLATVEYLDGAGGRSETTAAGSGGRVESAEIDVSGQDTLYIWVGGYFGPGRYDGGEDDTGNGAGSTEISFSNTNSTDSADEPFLVGAGGGGGGWFVFFGSLAGGHAGGRGGIGYGRGNDGGGTSPPLGGDGAEDNSTDGEDGSGAIDDQNRGLVTGGTTIKGGGSAADTNGEVKITYESTLSPPDPPSNLSAEVQ